MSTCATETVVTVSLGPESSPLVLFSECADGISWTKMSLPDWTLRYLYAPPSNYVPGDILLAVVQDSGAMTITVSVEGTSLSDMEAKKTTLANALAAWPGLVRVDATNADGTVTIAGPWESFPTVPSWGEVMLQPLGYYYAETTISVPVNPPGSP